MFDESLAPRTQFDLNFRIGDIPVRVHPYFWLSTLFLGLGNTRNRPADQVLSELLAWAVILFVSILVHELGHVLMGRYFGSRGHIILTGFCGLAVGSSTQHRRSQRIAVYLAGPCAGFLFGGVVFAGFWLWNPDYAVYVLGYVFGVPPIPGPGIEVPPWKIIEFSFLALLSFNFFWGLINLLPIWPLDGGQVCREICEAYKGRDGLRLSLQISMFAATAVAVLALAEKIADRQLIPFVPLGGSLFVIIFFGLLAFQSYQLFVHVQRVGPGWKEEWNDEPRESWEQDPDWWKK